MTTRLRALVPTPTLVCPFDRHQPAGRPDAASAGPAGLGRQPDARSGEPPNLPAGTTGSGCLGGLAALVSGGGMLWPYTWGRVFRVLDLPVDLLYRLGVSRTIVLGEEHLRGLPRRVIFAGTHHSFADVPLVRHGLAKSGLRRQARRLITAAGAEGEGFEDPFYAAYGILALGLYPLQRGEARERSLRGLARLAAAGNPVLIFPQGTHAKPEQERAGDPAVRFRPGVTYLARALDAVVVPFGLAGTEALIPPDARAFTGRKVAGIPVSLHRGPLAVAFGSPLAPEPSESPRAFAARLEAASYALTRDAEAALRAGGTKLGRVDAESAEERRDRRERRVEAVSLHRKPALRPLRASAASALNRPPSSPRCPL